MSSRFLSALAGASVAFFGASGASAAVNIDFEGGTDKAFVNEFFNGGTDSAGASGPDLGVSFTGAGFDNTSAPAFGIPPSIGFMKSNPITFTADVAFNMIAFDRFFFAEGNILTLFDAGGNEIFRQEFGQNCFPTCTLRRESFVLNGFAVSGRLEPNQDLTGIDNLTLSAVPEPATWAMMIGGFGMVGGAMRSARRRTKVSYATA